MRPPTGSGRRLKTPLAWAVVLVVVLVLARTLLSVYDIDRPGLQYDEALFVNAANNQIGNDFIAFRLLGVPLMLMKYIGALKSYIYFPIFSLLDVSVLSIRFPSIIITGLALVLLFFALRRALGLAIALTCVAMLALDNSLLWLTRNDVAPLTLEFLLKCAAIYAVALAVITKRTRYVAALLVICAAGLFNKLNFVWYLNVLSLLSVGYVVSNRQRLAVVKRPLVVWIVGITVLYSAFCFYYFYADLPSAGARSLDFGERLYSFATQMPKVLDGTWFFNYALAPKNVSPIVAGSLILLFCVGVGLSLKGDQRCDRAIRPFWVATLLISAQILLTRQAGTGWHYIGVFPFFHVTAAYGLCRAGSLVTRRRAVRAMVPAGAVLALLLYHGWLYSSYARQLSKEPSNVAWSPAIYALSDYARGQHATVYTIDWGIHSQLLAFQATPGKYKEAVFFLRSGSSNSAWLAEWLFSRPESLYVLHRDAVFPGAQGRFRRMARATGHPVGKVRTIVGLNGKPVFDVYRQVGPSEG